MKCVYLASGRDVWALHDRDGTARCVFDALCPAGNPPAPLDWALAMPETPVAVLESEEPPLPGAEKTGLRTLFDIAPAGEYAAAAEAVPVREWRRTSRYCGACGEPMARDSAERCMVCPRCSNRVYPRINPAVITCITRNNGEEVLLARRATPPNGFYSVIAGFVEVGESLEHAMVREVREEVGLEITRLRYFGSQTWPFPNSLMIGFLSECDGGEPRPDGAEIAEAGWYRRGGPLPTLPGRASIARRMVDAWAEHLL